MHTDDMNDLVLMGLARDQAEAERAELAQVVELFMATIRHCGEPLPRKMDPTFPHPDSICCGNLRSALRVVSALEKLNTRLKETSSE